MKGAQLLKVFTGQPADDVAALAAEIDAEKAKASEACSRLEWLERERKTADTFEKACGLDDQIAELRWTIGKADERLPHLEGRLRAARAEKQAAALARHQAILRKRYPKFRAALQEAVEQQAEVIREREAAVGELGEHLAQIHLPHIAYAGFLFKDLLAIWTAEQDRVFADPLPKPVVVAPRPVAAPAAKPTARTSTGEAASPDFGFGWTSRQPGDEPVAAPEPQPRPKRVPRRDTPAAGQRLITILRSTVDVDGYLAINGDVLAVSIAAGEALVKGGAADFTGETNE